MKFHLLRITLAYLSTLSFVIHTVECEETTRDQSWYSDLSVVVHHNGEIDPCGSTGRGSIKDGFIKTLGFFSNKYEFETGLTNGLARLLENDRSMCGSDGSSNSLFSFCDAGTTLTPILLDHRSLLKTNINTLPCRFFSREGLRIQTLEQLKTIFDKARLAPSQSCANPQDGTDATKDCEDPSQSSPSLSPAPEIHLYAVPAGRVFHFAPAFVGEIFELDHMTLLTDSGKPIFLKVLSLRPKVFDILNVFTKEEADNVVTRALAETSPTHKIKRSTTGSENSDKKVFSKRTSENGFDTSGKVALALKKRIFEVLGYDVYLNGHDDGLQVLRYNLTTAYVPHFDYLPVSRTTSHNYGSAQKGGNRYATVLLYMTDIPERSGGETVFSEAWPEGRERQLHSDALEELRASGDADRAGIKRDSWEEEMVATCRSRLSVKPYSGRAVLFYSQLPNGEKDLMSLHGGCPVLQGDKWAANLWVWNTPREGYTGAPKNEGAPKPKNPVQRLAKFKNSGNDASMNNAELYYDEAMFWGKLEPNEPSLNANTFEGHRWTVKVDGKVVKNWVIGKDLEQVFVI